MSKQFNSRTLLKLALALLPLLVLALSAMAITNGSGGLDDGTWVLSRDQDCNDPGLVCTEWELLATGEHLAKACCQDPSVLGSTVFTVCPPSQEHFRH
ncbi:MAG: hypothetical protein KDD47_19835 [Acidobacteria bacterium]|nr:hypothetical protein [Acidobacteriota bacterium]